MISKFHLKQLEKLYRQSATLQYRPKHRHLLTASYILPTSARITCLACNHKPSALYKADKVYERQCARSLLRTADGRSADHMGNSLAHSRPQLDTLSHHIALRDTALSANSKICHHQQQQHFSFLLHRWEIVTTRVFASSHECHKNNGAVIFRMML